MLDKGTGKTFPFVEKQFFEFNGTIEFSIVRQGSRGIDRGIRSFPGGYEFTGSPLSDGIVLVKGQTQRINGFVTGGAIGILGVGFDALANGDLIACGGDGFDWVGVGRWGGRGLVENSFTQPYPAMNRAMAGAVLG